MIKQSIPRIRKVKLKNGTEIHLLNRPEVDTLTKEALLEVLSLSDSLGFASLGLIGIMRDTGEIYINWVKEREGDFAHLLSALEILKFEIMSAMREGKPPA